MFNKFWKNKNVLITGHNGFTGTWLTKFLLLSGAKIMGISIKNNYNPDLYKKCNFNNKRLKSYICDITNQNKLNEIIKNTKIDIVFHLAAQSIVQTGYKEPYNTYKTNIIGSINLFEILKKQKRLKSIIVATTDKVYKNDEKKNFFVERDHLGGDDHYSASKASLEVISNAYYQSFYKEKKISVTTLRAGNIIGGGDWNKFRLIPDIVRHIYHNRKLVIRSPKSVRPWQHILDVIYIYSAIALKTYKNHNLSGPYNVSLSNKKISVNEVINFIKKKNLKIKIQNKNGKFKEKKYLLLKSEKILKMFNLKNVINIKEGLMLTMQWYKNYYNKKNVNKLIEHDIKFYLKKYY